MKFTNWLSFCVISLCLITGIFLHQGAKKLSTTFDEAGHLLSSLDVVRNHDTSFYYVNPPLLKIITGLYIEHSDLNLVLPPPLKSGDVRWHLRARNFANENRSTFLEALNKARTIVIVFFLLTALSLFFCVSSIANQTAGFVSFALWTFSPFTWGFANLFTMDIPVCFFLVWITYFAGNFYKTHKPRTLYFFTLTLMLSFLTKFSTILILPALLFGFVMILKKSNARKMILLWLGASFVIALFLINLLYFFNHTPTRLSGLEFQSVLMTGRPYPPYKSIPYNSDPPKIVSGNRFRNTWIGNIPLPFPRDMILGLDEQKSHEDMRLLAYINGDIQNGGWWYYYLYCAFVKLPEIFFLMLALAAFSVKKNLFKEFRHDPFIQLSLLCFVSYLVLISFNTGINVHFRYALPVYLYLCILMSTAAAFFEKRMALIALTLLLCTPIAMTYPDTLSYFNTLSGGSRQGWRRLVDSNHDWGQDLIALKEWMDRHPEVKVINAGLQTVIDPAFYGLKIKRAAPQLPTELAKYYPPYPTTPTEGWYAISGSSLAGMPFLAYDGEGRWYPVPLRAFDYLKNRTPDDYAGLSISLFYISGDEAKKIQDAFKKNGFVLR
jgi:hypothetical protein